MRTPKALVVLLLLVYPGSARFREPPLRPTEVAVAMPGAVGSLPVPEARRMGRPSSPSILEAGAEPATGRVALIDATELGGVEGAQ